VKRSTITAVALTAGILIVAGNVPRLPWDGVARAWRDSATQAVAQWPSRIRLDSLRPEPRIAAPREDARATATSFGRVMAPAQVTAALAAWDGAGPVAFAVGGALAGLVLLTSAAWFAARAPQDPRSLVFRLARRGEPMALIARSARMPQDAVRTLLAPGVGSRRG